MKDHTKSSKITKRVDQLTERQGIGGVASVLLGPAVATGVTAGLASGLAVYGAYQEEITRLFNSLFRKSHLLLQVNNVYNLNRFLITSKIFDDF